MNGVEPVRPSQIQPMHHLHQPIGDQNTSSTGQNVEHEVVARGDHDDDQDTRIGDRERAPGSRSEAPHLDRAPERPAEVHGGHRGVLVCRVPDAARRRGGRAPPAVVRVRTHHVDDAQVWDQPGRCHREGGVADEGERGGQDQGPVAPPVRPPPATASSQQDRRCGDVVQQRVVVAGGDGQHRGRLEPLVERKLEVGEDRPLPGQQSVGVLNRDLGACRRQRSHDVVGHEEQNQNRQLHHGGPGEARPHQRERASPRRYQGWGAGPAVGVCSERDRAPISNRTQDCSLRHGPSSREEPL